jgi:toxin ParE1/3/4
VARVHFSAAARRDLADIYRYIRAKSGNGETARRFVHELRQKCAELAAAPIIMGRLRKELRSDLRSHPHKSYLIFFRYVGSALEVVSVVEGHRDVATLFRQDEKG